MEDKKKFVLITGSSSGIGRAIALGLSNNHNIILHGRNNEKLLNSKERCSKKYEQLIFNHDLNNVIELDNQLSTFIQTNNIEISHFVHCAGYMKMLPLKSITLDVINTTFNTNVISATLIMKILTNRRINNSAIISAVFISSNISNFGAKAFSVYSASKSGLDGLMRSLAVELAPKVRINSVLPGGVKTEMTESIFEDATVKERIEATYPLGLGEPNDIFEMVSFLLSEKSRWITGQQFTVDGGRTINITG
jgi:NAD(P)-dependent dehydrogenase (short-subunit alcohol dehydrogenase family)